MEICCFPQSISTYFYKFQSISIILSPYHSYLLIPFLTLLIYTLNGYVVSQWVIMLTKFSGNSPPAAELCVRLKEIKPRRAGRTRSEI
ncbi:MAG: hypothetical protein AB1422_08705, partial [bacterium]